MQIEAPPSQQVYKLQGSSLLETWISAVIQINKKECLERKNPKIYKANWSMDNNRNQITKISNKKSTEIIFFIQSFCFHFDLLHNFVLNYYAYV